LTGIYFGRRPNNEFVWEELNELIGRELNLSGMDQERKELNGRNLTFSSAGKTYFS